MAGSIFYLAPVESASGKIFGRKQKFVAVRRVWGKRQKGCSVVGERDMVNHPYTEAEKAQQTKFGTICSLLAQRMQDPSKMVEDQMAFRAQTEYKTMRQYLWHVIEAELED